MREVVILGSTGSVGGQAVEVVTRYPDRFRVVGIAAGGGNVELLARQALDLRVEVVAVAQATVAQDLQLAFYAYARDLGYPSGDLRLPKILVGPDAPAELAVHPCDVVLNAVDGARGLALTLAALGAGRTVALANKESLVAGGPLVHAAVERHGGAIVPVDSEHTALAQCLRGAHTPDEIARLVVTASGGPFRGRTRDELADVTVEQAMAHPTWNMGPVITLNSATMVNKGLEVIEGHELFGIGYDRIDVVVQPKSIVHGMAEFTDGSLLLAASPPDMRVTIALALAWPDRLPGVGAPLDWSSPVTWEFEPLDDETFPAVRLAREAGERGGTTPAVYNAANEVAVRAFVEGRLRFLGIVDTVARIVTEHETGNVETLDDVRVAEEWARRRAHALISQEETT